MTGTIRQSLYEKPEPTTEELQNTVVLPTGEVAEHQQHFTWRNTRYGLLINNGHIRFLKGPDKPWETELVVWLQFDTGDEFRNWCIEEADDLVFHEKPSEQPDGVIERVKSAIFG